MLRVLIRRFAEEILSSQGAAPIETAQHLAVISEAMLRLWWSKVEPPKRSEGGCLLRTDHILGGAQSSTFIKQLSLVLEEITDENALNEP